VSNSKKQKPAAWRMSPVPPPAARQNPPTADPNVQGKTVEPHRVVWRGVETSAEATDLRRHAGGEPKVSAPTMWRGHQVVAAAPVAAAMPEPAQAVAEPARLAPVPVATATSGHELSSDTSLDDLFKAILGDQAGDTDDRALLLETVEAQVRGIRDELGLPEPVVEAPKPAPALVVAQPATVPDRTLGSFDTDDSTSKRAPGLFRMVAGLALGRFSHS
jgi:hypothetical protein